MALEELHAVTGRCACGSVAFSCSIEGQTCNCSCDLCRRNSGSAFQSWVNGARSSLLVKGEVQSWASSAHAERQFCRACGSPLFLFEHDEPEVVEVCAGAIDQPDGISSARQSFASKRPQWSQVQDSGLPSV